MTGLTLTGNPLVDLNHLRLNSTVMALRDQTGADMVVAIVQNSGTAFPACGFANVQTYPGGFSARPGCGPGAAFDAFAYSLTGEGIGMS